MSQPTNYTPTTDFSQQEAINASGRSTVNTAALDLELANIETTLDQTLSNLALLQRDDGRLKDVIVDVYTLAPDVLNLMGGFNLRGLWATATAYALNDICSNGAYTYVCKTAHTSGGAFDASKWIQFGFTSGADAAQAAAAAQVSASAAAGSASTASTAATNASNSATSATNSATSASSSASTATTKAADASASATSAANSAAAAAASIATVTFPISVLNGGTGATSAGAARTTLDVPSSSGAGASGTWGISISGNAATATTAKNAAVDSASGTFGYVTGAGGTVTQATSKSTLVTLNKPSGQITMHNAALSAGATVEFQFNNSLIAANDGLSLTFSYGAGLTRSYSARASCFAGGAFINVKNESGSSQSEAVQINFEIIKGATA